MWSLRMHIQAVSFPKLTALGKELWIRDNTVLASASFPLLKTIGTELYVGRYVVRFGVYGLPRGYMHAHTRI